jgi:hypothetical protein
MTKISKEYEYLNVVSSVLCMCIMYASDPSSLSSIFLSVWCMMVCHSVCVVCSSLVATEKNNPLVKFTHVSAAKKITRVCCSFFADGSLTHRCFFFVF